MGREIKFRMWSKEYEQMFDTEGLSAMYCVCEKVAKKFVPEVSESEVPMPLTGIALPFQDDAVLMQFTGRKDISSVDVYEGDIVVVTYGKWYGERKGLTRIGTVIFSEVDAKFAIKINNSKVEIGFHDSDKNGIEVIGNIYENPELLKS